MQRAKCPGALSSRLQRRLAASVGSFSGSIGIRDGKYRVDPTGKGM
jgi:hypothetical protein